MKHEPNSPPPTRIISKLPLPGAGNVTVDHALERQRDEIQGVMNRTGLTIEQMAERLVVKPATMRKYAEGWQRASERFMSLVRGLETGYGVGFTGPSKPMISSAQEDPPPYGGQDSRDNQEMLRIVLSMQSASQLARILAAILEDKNLSGAARHRASEEIVKLIQERK